MGLNGSFGFPKLTGGRDGTDIQILGDQTQALSLVTTRRPAPRVRNPRVPSIELAYVLSPCIKESCANLGPLGPGLCSA